MNTKTIVVGTALGAFFGFLAGFVLALIVDPYNEGATMVSGIVMLLTAAGVAAWYAVQDRRAA